MEFVNDIFVHTRGILGQNFMSRTSRLKEIGGFVDVCVAWGSDYLTYALMAKNGVIYCKEPLMLWRASGENVSTDGSRRMRILKLIAGIETQKFWKENIFPTLCADLNSAGAAIDKRLLASGMIRLRQLEDTFVADARALTGSFVDAWRYYWGCLIMRKRALSWFLRFWLLKYFL